MNQTNAQELLKKYNAGTATEAERTMVENWYNASNYHTAPGEEHIIRAKDRIWAAMNVQPQRTLLRWPRIAAAASVLLLLAAGAYFYFKPRAPQALMAQQHVILPGHQRATLTLANGQQIVLTKSLTGKLAQQGYTTIRANGNNGIVYTTTHATSIIPVAYNTLTTAKGEQSPYPLILADGTKVWLNAESSITFPTAFEGGERLVKVRGEAYFEVIHNSKQPFRVLVKNQTIEDLGTQFNVNAYEDEPLMKTTLVEGSVRINAHTILKPGEEASIDKQAGIQVSPANIAVATAWKHGLFSFKKASIQAVMRQIARWYDVEVRYEGVLPRKTLTGEIYRSVNASEALQLLQYADVTFRIENKIIIVTANQN